MDKKERCKKGTRRSKVTGNCETAVKSTRCPRGSRRNKATGECDKHKLSVQAIETEVRHTERKQSVQDKERLDALILRQNKECPRIVHELQVHGRKTSHWAWWVFPTEKPGMSEPKPATAVTRENAKDLFKRAPRAWQEALELIVELGEKKGLHEILPDIDHPRVNYFVDLFSEVDTPPWMKPVLQRLRMLLTDARQIPTLVKQEKCTIQPSNCISTRDRVMRRREKGREKKCQRRKWKSIVNPWPRSRSEKCFRILE